MSPTNDPRLTMSRRRMLQGLLALGGTAAVGGGLAGVPGFLRPALAGPPLRAGEKLLVVVTLDGGNDTLSTLVPYQLGRYFDARGALAIDPETVTDIGGGLGLHPSLRFVADRYAAGKAAFVLGIGEPTDDHSHFSAMGKWMSGTPAAPPYASGWLGRYLDALGGDPLAGVAVGPQGIPLLLRRTAGLVTGLPVMGDLFGADGRDETGAQRPLVHAHKRLKELGGQDIGKGRWAQAFVETQAEAIRTAVQVNPTYTPAIPADTDELIGDLILAARVINLDVGARVLHVTKSGFDTHTDQRPEHDNLLGYLDTGIRRFYETLAPRYHDQVTVLCWSEFGRRIEANGSAGTDHGWGGMAMLLGEPVTGGIYGEQPALNRPTERGDLRVQVDYRSLYGTVLDGFLGADSSEIIGGTFENLGIFDQPVFCDGKRATIVGTATADRLRGTRRADVIAGLGGNDAVTGLGGNDTICGGDGNDKIAGSAGSDRLFGDRGNDRLSGDAGRDRLDGGKGRDQLRGGAGRDRLIRDRQDVVVRQ